MYKIELTTLTDWNKHNAYSWVEENIPTRHRYSWLYKNGENAFDFDDKNDAMWFWIVWI